MFVSCKNYYIYVFSSLNNAEKALKIANYIIPHLWWYITNEELGYNNTNWKIVGKFI